MGPEMGSGRVDRCGWGGLCGARDGIVGVEPNPVLENTDRDANLYGSTSRSPVAQLVE